MRLFLAGDVMLGRGVDQILMHPSRPELFEPFVRDARDYVELAEKTSGAIPRNVTEKYVWGDLLELLDGAAPSARVINLETSITTADRPYEGKSVHYRMHPSNVDCLSAAKIDACVLSNNHVLDWGERGLLETLDVLARAGVVTTGAGRTLEEAQRPAVLRCGGGRVLLFGLGDDSAGVPRSWAATATKPGIDLLPDLSDATADSIAERIRSHEQPGDIVVVAIHWGSNWGYDVPGAHVRFARALVDRGVDVVHGHSSHHPRPIEIYNDRLILYGCGDLLNDYEGIARHRAFRGDLTAAYLPALDHDGRLIECVVEPLRIRKLRLERAPREDAEWLGQSLQRISAHARTSLEAGRIVMHRAQ